MSETYFNDADIGPGWPAIRTLMPGDPVLGGADGVSNAPSKGLMQRTILLRALADTMAGDLAALSDQVDLLSSADGPALEDALRALLEERWPWRYYEVFSAGWTLIQTPDRQPVPVTIMTTPVPGDDSLDVTATGTLRTGSGYVVWDAAGRQEVTITEILTATRIRIAPALAIPLAAGAQIAQTDWAVAPRAATAAPGSAYYARPIDLGPAAGQRAIVVRSAPTAASLRAWWRPASGVWTECVWSWRRSGTDYAGRDWQEAEYILPASGLAQIRVTVDPDTPEAVIDPVTIRRIVILEGPTNLGGIGNGPIQPAALSPAAGAVGVGAAPALTLSAYASPTGAAQAGIEAELRQGTITLLASGLIAGATTYALAPGLLLPASNYAWRGRYHDARGIPSPWSDWAGFSTASTFASVQPPSPLLPVAGATGVARSPTLTASPMSVIGGSDTHAGSQWQITTADGAPLYDSGEVTDLTSRTAAATLDNLAVCQWRVRYRGAALGWSDWSAWRGFVVVSAGAAAPTILTASSLSVTATPGSLIGGGGTHQSTEWEVTTAAGAAVWSSGEDADALTAATPGGWWEPTTGYRARCRQKVDGFWSDWSGWFSWITGSTAIDEVSWTAAGTYTWSSPPGWDRVDLVVIGAGGVTVGNLGGGGGGLSWANNIPTPALSHMIIVAATPSSPSDRPYSLALGVTAESGQSGPPYGPPQANYSDWPWAAGGVGGVGYSPSGGAGHQGGVGGGWAVSGNPAALHGANGGCAGYLGDGGAPPNWSHSGSFPGQSPIGPGTADGGGSGRSGWRASGSYSSLADGAPLVLVEQSMPVVPAGGSSIYGVNQVTGEQFGIRSFGANGASGAVRILRHRPGGAFPYNASPRY